MSEIEQLEKENKQLKIDIEYQKKITAEQNIEGCKYADFLNNELIKKDKEIKVLKKALEKASIEAFGKKVSFVISNYPTKITNSVEYAEYLLSETEKEIKDGNQ